MPRARHALHLLLVLASTPSAEEPESIRWDTPVEVASRSTGALIPVSLARTPSGAVGVFGYEKGSGLVLHVSKDGKAPWKRLLLAEGVAGDARVEEELIEAVTTEFEGRRAKFGVFDPVKGAIVRQVRMAETLPSVPMFSRLLADGKARYVLLGCERGEIYFLSSADAGATWTAPLLVAQARHRDDAAVPALYRIGGRLHVLSVDVEDRLHHQVSDDGGATWTSPGRVAPLPPEAGTPLAVAGSGTGPELTAVVLTSRGSYRPLVGEAGGARWEDGKPLGQTTVDDLALLFQARSVPKLSVFAWTEPGESRRIAGGIRLLASRDGGLVWAETGPDDGCVHPGGFAAVFLDTGGRISVAFAVPHDPANPGAAWLLVRSTLLAGESASPVPAESGWWRGGGK